MYALQFRGPWSGAGGRGGARGARGEERTVGLAVAQGDRSRDRRGGRARADAGWRCVYGTAKVSMIDGAFFDKLEFVARRVRHNLKPFGGLQVILCGTCLMQCGCPCVTGTNISGDQEISSSFHPCANAVWRLSLLLTQREFEHVILC